MYLSVNAVIGIRHRHLPPPTHSHSHSPAHYLPMPRSQSECTESLCCSVSQNEVGLQIDFSKLELGAEIGTGAFSKVRDAIYMGERVAVKQLVDASQSTLENLIREVKLCSQLRHGFIVSLRGVCLDLSAVDARGSPLGVCLVMQLAQHGSILKALDKPDIRARFGSWNRRLTFLAEAANGGYCLHSQTPPIIHRDIKPANLLLTAGLQPLLADFGLACRLGEETGLGEGTQNFMAPELFGGEDPSCASDIYAFGLTMQFVVAVSSGGQCSEPWAGMTNVQIQELVEKGFRPEWPKLLEADSSLSRFLQVIITVSNISTFSIYCCVRILRV
jgi:serine/threonine protein kinase